MVHPGAITVAAAALLAALPASASLYTKSSPVIQVDGRNYDRLIAQSNYTSIVEFYAPWCGHCKTLAPTYEKVATTLKPQGVNVGKVDCTVQNGLLRRFGVRGFPTLKFAKGGDVYDYSGDRSEANLVSFSKTGYKSAASNPFPPAPSA